MTTSMDEIDADILFVVSCHTDITTLKLSYVFDHHRKLHS